MTTIWVERYLAAWNSHDGAQVAAFMTDDVTYEDLAQGAAYVGHEGVAAYVGRRSIGRLICRHPQRDSNPAATLKEG